MTISREGDGIARITSYPDLAKYVGTRVEIIGKPAGDHKGFGNFIPEIHDRSGPRAVRGPVTVIAPGATEAIRWPEAVIDRRLLVIGTLRSELLNKPKFAGMEAQGPRDGTVLYDVIDARYEPLDEAEGAGEEDAPGGITRITFFSDLVKHVGTRVEITGKPAEDLNGFGNFIPDLYDRIGTGLLLVDEPVTVVARGDAQPLHWPESAIGRRLRVIGTLKSATWKAKHGIPEQGPADGTVLYGLTDAWYELLDRAEGAREDGARKGE